MITFSDSLVARPGEHGLGRGTVKVAGKSTRLGGDVARTPRWGLEDVDRFADWWLFL